MWYLLYDSHCSLCAYLAAWVHVHDRYRVRFAIFPMHDPQARSLIPQLSDEEYRSSFHVVSADGRVASGEAAIPLVLQRLPGLWGLVGVGMQTLPGGRWLTALFYRVLAAQRERARRSRRRS